MNILEIVVTGQQFHGWARNLSTKLAELTGGASLYEGTGLWVDDREQMHEEPHVLIRTYTELSADVVWEWMQGYLQRYMNHTREEVVMVRWNDHVYFINEPLLFDLPNWSA
jgi:hypothetical protein